MKNQLELLTQDQLSLILIALSERARLLSYSPDEIRQRLCSEYRHLHAMILDMMIEDRE